jgi:hypothetical protein
MQRTCSKHPYEPSDNLCRSCGREYCGDCLVYPNGTHKLPLCLACAVAEAGLRSTARPQRKLPKREIRRRERRRIEDVTRSAEQTPIVFEQPLAGVRPFSEDTLPDWFALLEGLPVGADLPGLVDAADDAAMAAPLPGPAASGGVVVDDADPAEAEPVRVFPFLRPLSQEPDAGSLELTRLRPGQNPFAIESTGDRAMFAESTNTEMTNTDAAAPVATSPVAPEPDPRPPLPSRVRTGRRLADAVRTTQDFSADPFAADAFDNAAFGGTSFGAAVLGQSPFGPPATSSDDRDSPSESEAKSESGDAEPIVREPFRSGRAGASGWRTRRCRYANEPRRS